VGALVGVVGCGPWSSADGPLPVASDDDVVQVQFNGEALTTVTVQQLHHRLPLTSLLSDDADFPAWTRLTARGEGGSRWSVADPAARYTEHEVALFLHNGEAPALGVFRVLPPDASEVLRNQTSAPTLMLADVAQVDVWTTAPEVAPATPAPTALQVVIDGAEAVALTIEDLRALPSQPLDLPGTGGGDNKRDGEDQAEEPAEAHPALSNRTLKKMRADAWAITTILKRASRPKAHITLATFEDAEGAKLIVPEALLYDPASVAALRLNRRGGLVVELAKTEPDGTVTRERLRNAVRVVVELAK
jgi:hypothetical protein